MKQRLVTPENKKWWTLAAVSIGLFMIMLDNTVVNVALPSMRRSLHMSLSELEWVVAGYALTFAAFMLTGGKLADFLGRRMFFINVPVGILGLLSAPVFIEESRDQSAEQRLDVPGLATSAVGLFSLTYGFIEANRYGWTSGRILGSFAVAALALAVFVALE